MRARALPMVRGLAALALLWPALLWAQAAPKEITCYSDVFEPYVVQRGDEVRGIDVDALAEAGRRVGLTIRFKLLPWTRLENEIKRGAASEVECAFAFTHVAVRDAYMDFTTVPLKQSVAQFFARAGRFPGFKGIADLKGANLGIRRGFKLPPDMQEMVKRGELHVEEVDREELNFFKLSKGRIDVAMSSQDVGQTILRNSELGGIVALPPAYAPTPTFVVFNKAKRLIALVPLIDKGLRDIQNDGSYKKIRAGYL